MARYIDAEIALKTIDSYAKTVTADGKVVVDAIRDIVSVITPTADVALKSEVANEVLGEAIRTVYSKIDMKIYNTIDGKPLSDHVAYGKQMAMYDVIALLAELKKKYTEGNK